MAQVMNISDNTQPNCPLAYSLTIRHDGSNSGLRMCRLASNTRVVAAEAIAKGSAGDEISVIGFAKAFINFLRFHEILFIIIVTITVSDLYLKKTARVASGFEELYQHGSECLCSNLVRLTFQSAVLYSGDGICKRHGCDVHK
jgi:hypothetical protein